MAVQGLQSFQGSATGPFLTLKGFVHVLCSCLYLVRRALLADHQPHLHSLRALRKGRGKRKGGGSENFSALLSTLPIPNKKGFLKISGTLWEFSGGSLWDVVFIINDIMYFSDVFGGPLGGPLGGRFSSRRLCPVRILPELSQKFPGDFPGTLGGGQTCNN